MAKLFNLTEPASPVVGGLRVAAVFQTIVSSFLACGIVLFWLSARLLSRQLQDDGEIPPPAPGTSHPWYAVPTWLVVSVAISLAAILLGLMALRAIRTGGWGTGRPSRVWAMLALAGVADLGLIVWFFR